MKLVQGGLLVALGLGILWLAVTGRLNRIGDAWRYLVGGVAPSVKPTSSDRPAPSGRNRIAVNSAGFGLPDVLGGAFN